MTELPDTSGMTAAELTELLKRLKEQAREAEKQEREAKRAARNRKVHFELQFDPTEIPKWSAKYPAHEDDEALAAGRRIAAGDFRRDYFETIFIWKAKKRPLHHLEGIEDEEIADALELAMRAKTPRAAIAVLTGISGVNVPIASALLAMISPDQFTVIDFRALQSLGIPRSTTITLGLYLQYNPFCRALAAAESTCLRTLDRSALEVR